MLCVLSVDCRQTVACVMVAGKLHPKVALWLWRYTLGAKG